MKKATIFAACAALVAAFTTPVAASPTHTIEKIFGGCALTLIHNAGCAIDDQRQPSSPP